MTPPVCAAESDRRDRFGADNAKALISLRSFHRAAYTVALPSTNLSAWVSQFRGGCQFHLDPPESGRARIRHFVMNAVPGSDALDHSAERLAGRICIHSLAAGLLGDREHIGRREVRIAARPFDSGLGLCPLPTTIAFITVLDEFNASITGSSGLL